MIARLRVFSSGMASRPAPLSFGGGAFGCPPSVKKNVGSPLLFPRPFLSVRPCRCCLRVPVCAWPFPRPSSCLPALPRLLSLWSSSGSLGLLRRSWPSVLCFGGSLRAVLLGFVSSLGAFCLLACHSSHNSNSPVDGFRDFI